METYRVKIKSRGNGWTENRTVKGELSVGEGITLKYTIDGDICELTVKDGIVTQVRRGENNTSLTFKEGETTDCIFGHGGFSGSFEIFTTKIKTFSADGVFKLTLEYSSGTDKENIKLALTAVKISTQEIK